MKEIEPKPMKAVYSFPFPEVRASIREVEKLDKLPLLLTQTSVNEAQAILAPLNLTPELELPQTADGKINLDLLHEPIIKRLLTQFEPLVAGLDQYPHLYPTAGSSEGLFHVLSQHRAKGLSEITTLAGEYEGYKEYGKALGIHTLEVKSLEAGFKMTPRTWFISNPNARDGMIIPNDLILQLAQKGHKIHLDLAYVGGTNPHLFDIQHPNIQTVFFSLSKPYGLFRYRVGFTLSRNPIQSLYANKWFKADPNHLIGLKVVEDNPPTKLAPMYKLVQHRATEMLAAQTGLEIFPSDAILLAHADTKQSENIKPTNFIDVENFRRGDVYRFCLTPYFEAAEKTFKTC